MSGEPVRKEGRGGAEAAQRHSVSQWQFWAAVVLVLLPCLLVCSALLFLIAMAFAAAAGRAPRTDAFGTIGLWTALALAATMILICAASYRRLWHLLRSLLRNRGAMVRVCPPLAAHHRWLRHGLGAVGALSFLAVTLLILRDLAPRTELLAAALWPAGYLALCAAVEATARFPCRADLFLPACAAVVAVYAFAVRMGFPAPPFVLDPNVRLLGPITLVVIVWGAGSGIYALRQFSRLQRSRTASGPGQPGGQGPHDAT